VDTTRQTSEDRSISPRDTFAWKRGETTPTAGQLSVDGVLIVSLLRLCVNGELNWLNNLGLSLSLSGDVDFLMQML
jgi:hypothetical protein